ncbi:unnamed protein product [Somion occarium]|uniref:Uncharacterized protein n=1 Tax=Somion occarium TaxID=3059160 RepID=A0ABP1DK07_9APHY
MSNVDLPEFLDPVLDYLSDHIPPTLYSVLETLLSHSIALVSSLLGLVTAFITEPSSWDTQRILPPLITLLTVYVALFSFYRTTGWMIRTAFAFVKWGTIFGLIGIGAGYILANANVDGEGNGVGALFAGAGLIPMMGGLILDMINGQGQDAAGGRRGSRNAQSSPRTRSRTQPNSQSRPNVWDSWDRHRDWQYSENDQAGRDSNMNVQQVVSEVLGAAGRVVEESGWWEAAKGAADGLTKGAGNAGQEGEGGSSGRRSTRRSKAKASRSR